MYDAAGSVVLFALLVDHGSLLDLASVPDLLRLLVIPFFAYVAWLDVKTRRVPNRLWVPLFVLGIILLVWELFAVTTGDDPVARREFYIQAAISIGFLIPLSYLFWRIGGFGGADAKAFFVIAILFPTFPTYEIWRASWLEAPFETILTPLPNVAHASTLPAVEPALGVFSITILSNTVLLGVLYPVALAIRNALTLNLSPGMFLARPIRWDRATEEYGTLFAFPDRRLRDDLSLSGLKEYSTWRGLDLDALRMYLQWRGITLAQLREQPDRYRDPATLPERPMEPGDGAIVDAEKSGSAHRSRAPGAFETEGDLQADAPSAERVASAERVGADGDEVGMDGEQPADDRAGEEFEDPWGAAAFLEDIEGSAYGTTPETLRSGLETLTTEDRVWISPGIPFLVPLFVGLVVAFTYGDILFVIFDAIGIAA